MWASLNMLHHIVVELLSICLKMFVFHIFHYFSVPTAKKNQPSTTIDTMTDNRPTQVDQDLLAINRQKTYTLYIHTGIRKGINGPHMLFLLKL